MGDDQVEWVLSAANRYASKRNSELLNAALRLPVNIFKNTFKEVNSRHQVEDGAKKYP